MTYLTIISHGNNSGRNFVNQGSLLVVFYYFVVKVGIPHNATCCFFYILQAHTSFGDLDNVVAASQVKIGVFEEELAN